MENYGLEKEEYIREQNKLLDELAEKDDMIQ